MVFGVAGRSRHASLGQLAATVAPPGVLKPDVRCIHSRMFLSNPGVPSQVAMPIIPPVRCDQEANLLPDAWTISLGVSQDGTRAPQFFTSRLLNSSTNRLWSLTVYRCNRWQYEHTSYLTVISLKKQCGFQSEVSRQVVVCRVGRAICGGLAVVTIDCFRNSQMEHCCITITLLWFNHKLLSASVRNVQGSSLCTSFLECHKCCHT